MAPVPASPTRVLVIDDDPVMRELLSFLLTAREHTVETAESGELALARLRKGFAANVILTDFQLPGIAGAALAAQLRSAAPHALLLGMSGSEPAAADRAAFDAFLLKPFTPDDFASAVLSASPAGSQAQAATLTCTSSTPAAVPLDETTYGELAASLPATQLAELYRLTLDDISARLALMRDALTAHDLAAYRREAHALKGGCSMVGAAELAALAARAEAGSFGDTESLAEFSAAAERLRSMITPRSTVY